VRNPPLLPPAAPWTPLVELRRRSDGSVVPLLTTTLDVERSLLDELLPDLHRPARTRGLELGKTEHGALVIMLRASRIKVLLEEIYAEHCKGDFHADIAESKFGFLDALPSRQPSLRLGAPTYYGPYGNTPDQYLKAALRSTYQLAKLALYGAAFEGDALQAGEFLAVAMYQIGRLRGEHQGVVMKTPFFPRAAERKRLREISEEISRRAKEAGVKSGKKRRRIDPEKVRARAVEEGWPEARGVAQRLAIEFGCSDSWISQVLNRKNVK